MKIERLIGIVFYLINRGKVTANQLAKHFQVSRRTILRDIDTLTLAGIPIYSEAGTNGGYTINKDFRVNEKIMDSTNSEYMLLAMESLKSVYGNKKVVETYEKVKHIYSEKGIGTTPKIDFSVANENVHVIEDVSVVKKAIQYNNIIEFIYTNSKGNRRMVRFKPLHIYYKWYSWYTFGHDIEKNEFRLFKVVRINNLDVSEETFINDFDVIKLMNQYESTRCEENIEVSLQYSKAINPLVDEYFLGEIVKEDSEVITRLVYIKEDDFMAFSIILGFGDRIKVISPKFYKDKITNHLKKTLNEYNKNSDT